MTTTRSESSLCLMGASLASMNSMMTPSSLCCSVTWPRVTPPKSGPGQLVTYSSTGPEAGSEIGEEAVGGDLEPALDLLVGGVAAQHLDHLHDPHAGQRPEQHAALATGRVVDAAVAIAVGVIGAGGGPQQQADHAVAEVGRDIG